MNKFEEAQVSLTALNAETDDLVARDLEIAAKIRTHPELGGATEEQLQKLLDGINAMRVKVRDALDKKPEPVPPQPVRPEPVVPAVSLPRRTTFQDSPPKNRR